MFLCKQARTEKQGKNEKEILYKILKRLEKVLSGLKCIKDH